jgi:hypothetical protein
VQGRFNVQLSLDDFEVRVVLVHFFISKTEIHVNPIFFKDFRTKTLEFCSFVTAVNAQVSTYIVFAIVKC